MSTSMDKCDPPYPSRMIKSPWNVKQRSSSSWPVITPVNVFFSLLIMFFSSSLCAGRGFQIQFDGVRAYIRLDPSYVNNTRGLCGTYDFNSQNDFLTHISIVETNIQTFADDYKTDNACSTPAQQHPCQQNVVVCLWSERSSIVWWDSLCLAWETSSTSMCDLEIRPVLCMWINRQSVAIRW